jgi:UDP-N-acetylmuramoyl-tripeptide--D-alanyl-D-alanine ligase
MIKVTTQWISRVLSGSMVGGSVDIEFVSTDTRTIEQGALFIALRGGNFDGHQFVDQAIARGAGAVVVDHQLDIDIPQIIVADTTSALGALGSAIKEQVQPKTIAITGSVGKTTVKEMVAAILSRLGNVLATKGNFNNEIGVPLTLLRLELEHDYAVIELGANHPGEIAYTTGLTKPDVCVINNIAPAHLEGFIDIQGVARAKAEIFKYSPPDCVAVVNCDSPFSKRWLAKFKDRPIKRFSTDSNKDVDVWVDDICLDEFGCPTFELYSKTKGITENILVQLTVPGMHNVGNALAAASLCISVGASLTDISLGLISMKPVKGRVNLIKVSDELTVIDDSYNANVQSAKAAIDLLVQTAGHKVLVFGDMAELGLNARSYHEQVGEYAKEHGVDHLLTLGVLSQNASELFNGNGKHFSTRGQLMPFLHQVLANANQKVTVLVKGSRSAKMELVVNALVDHYDLVKHSSREAS